MPRTKPADQRRDELLDAAEAAFIEHGITATTVDHITSGAGVAKGTFYLYFQSRADVVQAVQLRYGERFVRRLQGAIAGAGDDWSAKLDAVVEAGLDDHRDGRPLHDVLFVHAPPEPSDDLDDSVDRLVAVLRDLLDAGVAAGAYDVDDTSTTAMLLFNTLHGVYNPIWAGTPPADDTTIAAAAQALFRRTVGLAPSPSPAATRPKARRA